MLVALAVAQHDDLQVVVYHFLLPHWGDDVAGNETCLPPPPLDAASGVAGAPVRCEWHYHDNQSHFKALWNDPVHVERRRRATATVALYNIHSLWERHRVRYPLNCAWPTNLTLASSEESHARFHGLFNASFGNFDGSSTTHPASSVQRIYDAAYLDGYHPLPLPLPSSDLGSNGTAQFPAASFIASVCHKGPHAYREKLVAELRHAGVRVDGLGRCAKSSAPPGVVLHHAPHNNTLNTEHKRQVVAQYMFNLAFENSVEDGYVTEKPFDALIAGSVPVYLGDAAHLRRLLPHPKAAIFVADFRGNVTSLAGYLKHLIANRTAYHEHHAWRLNFSRDAFLRRHPALSSPWHCKVCRWAAAAIRARPQKDGHSATLC